MTLRILVSFGLLTLGLASCSKKEAANPDASADAAVTNVEQAATEPSAEPAPPEAASPPEAPSDNAQIAQDLDGVPNSLQQQDYDAAVDNLTVVGLAPKTEAQERAYKEQMYRTAEYLRQKAESDAKAREAYQKLGRRMMGR